MEYEILKRGIDILASLSVIVITSPLLLFIMLIILMQDFKNPIFKQSRIGKGGKEFTFYKFRSMPVGTPNVESSQREQIKITPFGKLLRRTNLDELPQLYSILIGDMSLIGPRPPIPSQVQLIDLRRSNGSLDLKPGLTGWAQVNSYDNMPDSVKANYDEFYFKNRSFKLDTIIVLKTLLYLTKKPPSY